MTDDTVATLADTDARQMDPPRDWNYIETTDMMGKPVVLVSSRIEHELAVRMISPNDTCYDQVLEWAQVRLYGQDQTRRAWGVLDPDPAAFTFSSLDNFGNQENDDD